MNPQAETGTYLVAPRIANLIRGFIEDLCRSSSTRLLPRDPDRGRVVEMRDPHLDLRIIHLAEPVNYSRLGILALSRMRTQIVIGVPWRAEPADLLIDLAVVQPGGALIVGGHRFWCSRSSWWIVPSIRPGRRFFSLSHAGCVEREHAPWIDQEEREAGFLEAKSKLSRVFWAGSSTDAIKMTTGGGETDRVRPPVQDLNRQTESNSHRTGSAGGSLSLYTATMVEPMGKLDRMFFAAFMCEREKDAYGKLARRIGLVSADRAAIRIGVDRFDPITAILVSNQMFELLNDAITDPIAAARDGLDLLIERRFTALRAVQVGGETRSC